MGFSHVCRYNLYRDRTHWVYMGEYVASVGIGGGEKCVEVCTVGDGGSGNGRRRSDVVESKSGSEVCTEDGEGGREG